VRKVNKKLARPLAIVRRRSDIGIFYNFRDPILPHLQAQAFSHPCEKFAAKPVELG
jgi:hypothetical protein